MLVDETGWSRVPSFRNPGGSAPGDGSPSTRSHRRSRPLAACIARRCASSALCGGAATTEHGHGRDGAVDRRTGQSRRIVCPTNIFLSGNVGSRPHGRSFDAAPIAVGLFRAGMTLLWSLEAWEAAVGSVSRLGGLVMPVVRIYAVVARVLLDGDVRRRLSRPGDRSARRHRMTGPWPKPLSLDLTHREFAGMPDGSGRMLRALSGATMRRGSRRLAAGPLSATLVHRHPGCGRRLRADREP